MFGYILPEKPELKVREYELFRAYYCGVCKTIAGTFGQLPRLTLNYDTTFLALLLSSLDSGSQKLQRKRCLAHPMQKRAVLQDCEALNYAADITIILAYYNLDDNWRDDRSVLSAAGKTALYPAFKKVKSRYDELCTGVQAHLAQLGELEKAKCDSLDKAAEPFASLMADITSCRALCKDEDQVKILKWLGYNLGKWIYTIDAFDDIEKDIKNKSYNPIVSQHRLNNEQPDELKNRIKERIRFAVTYSLSEISKAFELLDFKKNRELLENIIYMGMLRKSEQILSTRSCENIEKSV